MAGARCTVGLHVLGNAKLPNSEVHPKWSHLCLHLQLIIPQNATFFTPKCRFLLIFLPYHGRNASNLLLLQFKHQVQNPMVIHAILHVKQNSILAFQDLPLATICRVCNIYEVTSYLFTEYLLGGKTCHEAHINEQLLTDAQEEILVKWVKIQGHHGIPMTYASVAQCAGEISGKQVGETWSKWLCKHHPDLKMKKMMGLEKAHAKALNQFAVNEFFNMLTDVMKEYRTLASQSLITIRKDNILAHYHSTCIEALKPTTIQLAFWKTGIWPLNCNAIPLSAFELSKNTTTQAMQPLPTHLPSILVETPIPTPTPSATKLPHSAMTWICK